MENGARSNGATPLWSAQWLPSNKDEFDRSQVEADADGQAQRPAAQSASAGAADASGMAGTTAATGATGPLSSGPATAPGPDPTPALGAATAPRAQAPAASRATPARRGAMSGVMAALLVAGATGGIGGSAVTALVLNRGVVAPVPA